jgi:hypothetical protein
MNHYWRVKHHWLSLLNIILSTITSVTIESLFITIDHYKSFITGSNLSEGNHSNLPMDAIPSRNIGRTPAARWNSASKRRSYGRMRSGKPRSGWCFWSPFRMVLNGILYIIGIRRIHMIYIIRMIVYDIYICICIWNIIGIYHWYIYIITLINGTLLGR